MSSFPLFPIEASEGAARVDTIFLGLTVLAALIVLLVAGLVVGFALFYRRSARRNRQPLPGWLAREMEIGWVAATFFLFLFIFWWAAAQDLSGLEAPSEPVRIHVVAKQWMWKAEHADGTREINELHLPVGRDVLVSLNSQDVIHSFYIPAFRIKKDVVPGMTQQVWFRPDRPGRFKLLCAEFCGTDHARMTGAIVAMEPEAFARWADGAANRANLARQGAALFRTYGCSGCHRAGGAVKAPLLTGLFGSSVRLADGRTVTADPTYIRDSILYPGQDVVAGFEAAMPSFEGRIGGDDLQRILAYVESLGAEGQP